MIDSLEISNLACEYTYLIIATLFPKFDVAVSQNSESSTGGTFVTTEEQKYRLGWWGNWR